jgi:ATP-dependent Clp protease adaptor protein ClpS
MSSETTYTPKKKKLSHALIDDGKDLVLHNDDVHSFDFVIDALINICSHEPEQAEQCTYIVHYKGKCAVKKGTYNKLKPFAEGLRSRGLSATIE